MGGIFYGYVDSPIGLKGFVNGAPAGLAARNPSFFEGYFKPTYAVTDTLTLGLNFFATPSYLNTGRGWRVPVGHRQVDPAGSTVGLRRFGRVRLSVAWQC